MEIRTNDAQMEFYTNGQFLTSFSDNTWRSGQICFFIWVSEGDQATVDYDSLQIYSPDK